MGFVTTSATWEAPVYSLWNRDSQLLVQTMQFKYSASWCSCLSWRSMLEHKGGEGGNGFSSSKVNVWSMRECRDLSYNPWQELLVQRGSVAKHGQKPWAFGNPINGETINNLLRKLKRLSQNMHFYRSPTNFHREVSRRSVPKFPKFHFRSSFSLTARPPGEMWKSRQLIPKSRDSASGDSKQDPNKHLHMVLI